MSGELLTAEGLRLRLRAQLQHTGARAAATAALRSRLALPAHALGSSTLATRLAAAHLGTERLALHDVIALSGLPPQAAARLGEVLQKTPGTDEDTDGGTSVLMQLLAAFLAPFCSIAVDAGVQVDTQEESTLRGRLAAVEAQFEAAAGAMLRDKETSAEARSAQLQREVEQRARLQLEEEKERFRRVEETRIRLEVETKLRRELDVERQRIHDEYRTRQQSLESKERAMRENYATRERHLEASTHAERQKLLGMMERVEAREAQVKHEAAAHSRTFQQQTDAAQHAWSSLELKEAALRGLKDEYDRRLAAEMHTFKQTWEEEHAAKQALLAQRERELVQQSTLLGHQRDMYTAAQDEAARLTQELRQMHTELGTVTGRLAAAEARLAHTQSHDTVVARNHQLEEEKERLLRAISMHEARHAGAAEQLATVRCDAETRLADVTERLQHELDEAAARIDVLERIVAAEKSIAEAEHGAALEARAECARLRQLLLDAHQSTPAAAGFHLLQDADQRHDPAWATVSRAPLQTAHTHGAMQVTHAREVMSAAQPGGESMCNGAESGRVATTPPTAVSEPHRDRGAVTLARRRLLEEANERIARLEQEDKAIEAQLAMLRLGVPSAQARSSAPPIQPAPSLSRIAPAAASPPLQRATRLNLDDRNAALSAAHTEHVAASTAVADQLKTERRRQVLAEEERRLREEAVSFRRGVQPRTDADRTGWTPTAVTSAKREHGAVHVEREQHARQAEPHVTASGVGPTTRAPLAGYERESGYTQRTSGHGTVEQSADETVDRRQREDEARDARQQQAVLSREEQDGAVREQRQEAEQQASTRRKQDGEEQAARRREQEEDIRRRAQDEEEEANRRRTQQDEEEAARRREREAEEKERAVRRRQEEEEARHRKAQEAEDVQARKRREDDAEQIRVRREAEEEAAAARRRHQEEEEEEIRRKQEEQDAARRRQQEEAEAARRKEHEAARRKEHEAAHRRQQEEEEAAHRMQQQQAKEEQARRKQQEEEEAARRRKEDEEEAVANRRKEEEETRRREEAAEAARQEAVQDVSEIATDDSIAEEFGGFGGSSLGSSPAPHSPADKAAMPAAAVAVAADDQLAKYLALVTEQRAQEANKDTRTAAAATTEATAEEAYADSFEASESAEDSFAAGAGFGGIEAARGSVTPSRTPTANSMSPFDDVPEDIELSHHSGFSNGSVSEGAW